MHTKSLRYIITKLQMSNITTSELDALFNDNINMVDATPVEPETPTYPLTTFHPFCMLPPELRNQVYNDYMEDYYTSNPLRINAHGLLRAPPLINTSHSIRQETNGYMASKILQNIDKKDLRIEAQVLSYNPTPLRTTISALGTKLSVPEEKFNMSTTVTFVGPFNYENIISWISSPRYDFFKERPLQSADLRAYESSEVGMFTGPLSLAFAVDQMRYLESFAPAAWRYMATEFLVTAGQVGYTCARSYEGRQEQKQAVFEVVARWHYEMRLDLAQSGKKRMTMRQLKEVRKRHADMANAVYAFWVQCVRVLME